MYKDAHTIKVVPRFFVFLQLRVRLAPNTRGCFLQATYTSYYCFVVFLLGGGEQGEKGATGVARQFIFGVTREVLPPPAPRLAERAFSLAADFLFNACQGDLGDKGRELKFFDAARGVRSLSFDVRLATMPMPSPRFAGCRAHLQTSPACLRRHLSTRPLSLHRAPGREGRG